MITKMKAVIAASGLKQGFVARKVGVEYSLFSRYVTGDRECPEDVIKALAIFLKIPQHQLRGNINE